MWDYTYCTIGAWQCDGEILCPECNAKATGRGAHISISLAELNETYSAEGLNCGSCGDEIVAAPAEEHEEIAEGALNA